MKSAYKYGDAKILRQRVKEELQPPRGNFIDRLRLESITRKIWNSLTADAQAMVRGGDLPEVDWQAWFLGICT